MHAFPGREVGGPNSDLLSSPFFSPTYLVTPYGVHLLYLQELDSTANNRNDDDQDDCDDGLNQCSSKHHVLMNHLWTLLKYRFWFKRSRAGPEVQHSSQAPGVPVLLDHKTHWEVRASARQKLIPHLGPEYLEADPPALGHHSSIRGSNSELSALPSSARGFHP